MQASPANPYSPPGSRLEQLPAQEQELATLAQRAGGRLLDAVLAYLMLLPLLFSLDLDGMAELARDQSKIMTLYTSSLGGQVAACLSFALAALSWYLIATRGQTPGKILMGTRIVQLDGSPAGFVHGVLLRIWLLALPGYLALVGLALGAEVEQVALISVPVGWLIGASYLLIFTSARRCGHDYLAGTKVIQVEA